MSLPFDGAISQFFTDDAPTEIKDAISNGGKKDMLSDSYPYTSRMGRTEYDETMAALQIELVKITDTCERNRRADRRDLRGA